MLECVEEINGSKRFKAYFSDGKTARFGQTNLKKRNIYRPSRQRIKKEIYQASLNGFRNE